MPKTITICSTPAKSVSRSSGAAPHCAPWPTRSSEARDPPPSPTTFGGSSQQPRLSAGQMGRRRLMLGRQHNGDEVSLAVRGRTILIAGEPGTGKSWLAGLLCEQSILQGYCVCIIDPEGDYRSLEALPSVITLGGDDPPPQARELLRALRHPDVSVIVDLSKISHHEKREYLQTLLPLLVTLRRNTGLPHKILLDEAHYFLGGPDVSGLVDPELASYVFVTYRISSLSAAIRAAADTVVMVTRETDPEEARTLLTLCRPQPCAGLRPTCSEISRRPKPHCCRAPKRRMATSVGSSWRPV